MRGKAGGFFCGLIILLSGFFCFQFQEIMLSPEKYSSIVGESFKINFSALIENNIKEKLSFEAGQLKERASADCAKEPGQVAVKPQLFGALPLKNTVVSVIPELKLIPGGQSIGVLYYSNGVVIAGLADLTDNSGRKINPAVDSGLACGDIIVKIDNEDVSSDEQVREIVDRAGNNRKTITLEVRRGDKTFTATIKPLFCNDTSRYRLGLMIRDSTAGVGTLTFYDPKKMIYGALGHIINDFGTSSPADFTDGRIVGTNVQGIRKGKRGQPGEKIGVFMENKEISGSIIKNTKMGIFGTLDKTPDILETSETLPVGMAKEIHVGRAEILTVLQGEKVEKFSIEIIKVNQQARNDGKGLVLKITDQRLLEQTGGIVQGMSGSPIIQDNKLIGAVTHVFVNDPTKGFGVPLEWMLREFEILQLYGNFENQQKMAS